MQVNDDLAVFQTSPDELLAISMRRWAGPLGVTDQLEQALAEQA